MGKVIVRGQKARDLAVEIIHNGGTFEDAAKATGFGANYCRQLAKRSGMNFKKSKDDYIDEVALLSRVGQNAEEISAALSISISSVRKIAKENQIKIPRKALPSKFSAHEGYIRKAISAGKTYSDVARELGFSPSKTGEWCKRHGILLTEEGRAKGFHDGHAGRPYCTAQKKHFCPVCGAETTRIKFCSDKCRLKAKDKRIKARRRARIKAVIVDADISLKEVYRRDKGICHICGMACDWDDHKWRGNAFITGRLYPTIDHVIPLAEGGTHGWDNVRLAHQCCNSMKGAKLA